MENTHMLGTLVNTAAVILGALIGLLLKKACRSGSETRL
jgi:uncharacterized membrane protein YqgA involved in biofilm formation